MLGGFNVVLASCIRIGKKRASFGNVIHCCDRFMVCCQKKNETNLIGQNKWWRVTLLLVWWCKRRDRHFEIANFRDFCAHGHRTSLGRCRRPGHFGGLGCRVIYFAVFPAATIEEMSRTCSITWKSCWYKSILDTGFL